MKVLVEVMFTWIRQESHLKVETLPNFCFQNAFSITHVSSEKELISHSLADFISGI